VRVPLIKSEGYARPLDQTSSGLVQVPEKVKASAMVRLWTTLVSVCSL